MEKKTYIAVRRADREISLRDNTDQNNLPSGYNKGVRGFNKVADYIEANREKLEQMTMYSVISELDIVYDLKFRTYCAMD